jgi:DNA-binding response OmpR family regulator
MKTILIIEDDQQTQEIYKQLFESDEFTILQATIVEQAWDIIRNGKPDLIVLDIMLPGGANGFDFLAQLKRDEKLKNIPVIVLTNLDTEEPTAISMGASDYIVKTATSLTEIKEKVLRLLGSQSGK